MNEPQIYAGQDMDYIQSCLELKDGEFKEAFWDWFDNLNPKERVRRPDVTMFQNE